MTSVDALVAPIERHVDARPVGDALDVLDGVRARIDGIEAALLAARLESGVSPRSVERLLQRNDTTSKRSARTRTRRANAVKKNPTIAHKLQSGVLSSDQVDVIAAAAAKTDGAAAQDDALIERVAATPPDQARRIVDDWVREHTAADRVQDRYDRQRRRRCVKRWTTDRDTHVLALEGDEASIDRIELAIGNRSNNLYRSDGGRDPSPVQHVGGGLLPPTVLAEMFCGADIVGHIVDTTGAPLWLGRTTRYFTPEQVLALIARDRGCGVCGAHYSQCEAHHIIPWESPARGPTDIDNGALVCRDCHHWLHDHHLILVRDPASGTWNTRSAQAHEHAPKRRPHQPARPEHRRLTCRPL